MDPPGEHTAKRRKITLACNYCRSRKTRCDGRQPACTACDRKGWSQSCVYEQGALRTQRYVSSLEARLEEYQRRASIGESMADHRPSTETSAAPGLTAAPTYSDDGTANQDAWSLGSSSPALVRNQPTAVSATSPGQDLIGTDAMVVVPSPEDGSEGTIGESSLMAFVRSMLRAAGNSTPSLKLASSISINSAFPSAVSLPKHQDIDDEVTFLPPRRVADGFVASYWQFLHPILPILHKPSFMKSYGTLWETEKDIDTSCQNTPDGNLLPTVNIVLAIGCQFSDQVVSTRRFSVADKLYQRSKRLFTEDLLDSPTVSTVQLLLLTGIYLQSTNHANRCWNNIGLAVRAAQSIGLHLDRGSDRRNQKQREMDRRVWHACVFLDRQLAITFGRPTMILARSQVPPPQLIDDDFLLEDGEGHQPTHMSPQLGSFVYSNKLFDTLDNILVTFYVNKKHRLSFTDKPRMCYDELSDVLRFNMELDRFSDSVPDWLTVSQLQGLPKDPKIELGAKILYSRLLYIRVFLLRPVLLFVAQQSNGNEARESHHEDRMEQRLASDASRQCVSTAQTLIAHIHENMNDFYWTSISHKLHYAFSCAVVFIAARIGHASDLGISEESLRHAWSQCIELFEHYKPHLQSAAHVLRILEMLESRLRESTGSAAADNENHGQHIDTVLNLGRLEGLGLDANWAMLDDLLSADWFSGSAGGNFAPEEPSLGTGWDGLL